MIKLSFIFTLMASAAFFTSCSPLLQSQTTLSVSQSTPAQTAEFNTYGAYLAGRMAHIRKDFDRAADYYKIAYEKEPNNPELMTRLYLLLSSKGRIDEAADYAQKALDAKAENSFARMLIASKQLHDGQYAASIKSLNKIDDQIYKRLIAPLINTWNYAGLGNQDKAFEELRKLSKEDGLGQVTRQHRAMLFDFFGKNREAAEIYQQILNDKNSEISVRLLEIISNFYIRTGQKEIAVAMMQSTINNSSLDSLLSALRKKVNDANPKTTPPVLSSAQIGASEALFTIASTFRYDEAIDVAHMYTALAIYMNPEYNTAKVLMADIFEMREMYDDANTIYDSVSQNDIAYYAAQFKKARNLVKKGAYKQAEILLKTLEEDYNDMQIDLELGDILRLTNRFSEAVEYYDKAISKTKNKGNLWILYYAKGVALDSDNRYEEAQAALLKAYQIKKHYLVSNHLGYSWIRQKKNVNEAFKMIIDAYNQAPFDPSINDSLGFALYNLGYYAMAIPYLERAAELYPSSAVISSHLGDAYWFAHRKNEARFQWKHALSLKDDSGELDIKKTKAKVKNGIAEEPALTYDKEQAEKDLKTIKKFPEASKEI
ncbi:MAG: tetratricopeptide repeat protein [Alphaproteobacteria bacterium]|nr:tetratricopeptide repeat protein [Alphaproteobacteria bacterium]